MAIDDVVRVLAPPSRPREVSGEMGWGAVEASLGTSLPADYKDFVDLFGTGSLGDFLWILNPFSTNRNLNLLDQTRVRLQALADLMESEDVPYRLFPESEGLLPCAFTDNGDVLYWLTREQPNQWPLVLNAGREPEYEEYPADLTRFISEFASGVVRSRIFPPDVFRLPVHFRPL